MAQELRADPDALIALADACLAAADGVGSHYRTDFGDLSPASAAFGNTRASAAVARAAAAAQAEADGALQAQVQVLEGDADRLLQAAFAYLAADRLAGRHMGASRRAPL